MLIDSDVLVWLTRGHPGAAARLRQIPAWRISAVTYMELAQGCRDKAELERVKQALSGGGVQIAQIKPVPIDGKANAELIALVADRFQCHKSAVTIKSGTSGRTKLVRIDA